MPKDIPHLIERNAKDFFSKLEIGQTFTYSFAQYDARTVIKMAEEKGLVVEYCRPGTPEYKIHGCTTCKLLAKKSKTTPKTIVIHSHNPGDSSVGIWPYDETYTLTKEHGEWNEDEIQAMKEIISELEDTNIKYVLTDEENTAQQKAEREWENQMDENEELVRQQIKDLEGE